MKYFKVILWWGVFLINTYVSNKISTNSINTITRNGLEMSFFNSLMILFQNDYLPEDVRVHDLYKHLLWLRNNENLYSSATIMIVGQLNEILKTADMKTRFRYKLTFLPESILNFPWNQTIKIRSVASGDYIKIGENFKEDLFELQVYKPQNLFRVRFHDDKGSFLEAASGMEGTQNVFKAPINDDLIDYQSMLWEFIPVRNTHLFMIKKPNLNGYLRLSSGNYGETFPYLDTRLKLRGHCHDEVHFYFEFISN